MKNSVVAIVFVLAACGKDSGAPAASAEETDDLADEARKDLADLESALAANNTSHAAAVCSVAKPGMAKLKAKAPVVGGKLERMCNRDRPLKELANKVAELEAERKAEPTGRLMGCSGLQIYRKPLEAGGYGDDPEVVALSTRWTTACAPR